MWVDVYYQKVHFLGPGLIMYQQCKRENSCFMSDKSLSHAHSAFTVSHSLTNHPCISFRHSSFKSGVGAQPSKSISSGKVITILLPHHFATTTSPPRLSQRDHNICKCTYKESHNGQVLRIILLLRLLFSRGNSCLLPAVSESLLDPRSLHRRDLALH